MEDETGTAAIHIWDPLFKNIKTGTTLEFENLSVKHFQGVSHWDTTPTTTMFKEAHQPLKTINCPALLEIPEKEAKVKRFKIINKLSIFLTCQACKHKLLKSPNRNHSNKNCGVGQRKMECKQDDSFQLLVPLEVC